VLPVRFEYRLVGHLQRDAATAGLTFDYAPAWRNAPDGFAISVGLPRESAPQAAFVNAWFANLLPEEDQLRLVGRLLGHAPGDIYGLLEEIGRDLAGALSVGDAGRRHGDYRDLGDRALARILEQLPRRPLLAGEPAVTMSLAGAQAKLPVAVFGETIALPLHGAASTHILKPQSERFYATVENELLCMRLAGRVGLAVAATTMGRAGGRKFLLVARYDRRRIADRKVQRLHQEDFCQALGLYPTQKYQRDGGPGLAELFAAIDRHSLSPARDRLALLDLVVFACCIGDTDRHGKNFSLLLGRDGPRLAPGYDLMSALVYDGITPNMAMKIADQSRAEHVQMRHWQRFARAVGLAPAATVARAERLAGRVADGAAETSQALAAEFPVADRDALALFADRIARRAARIAANARRGDSAGKAS
jgi:serine/threonine-protein kinase HipA